MAQDTQNSGKQPATAASIRARAEGAIREARTKAFEAKLKPELEKLTAAEEAVVLQTQKIETMMAEFDEANGK